MIEDDPYALPQLHVPRLVAKLIHEFFHHVRIFAWFLEPKGVQGVDDLRSGGSEGGEEQIVPVSPWHAVDEIEFVGYREEVFDDVELVTFHRRVEEFAPVLLRCLVDYVHRDRHKMAYQYEISSCVGNPPCSVIQAVFPGVMFCCQVNAKAHARPHAHAQAHRWRKVGQKISGSSYYKCLTCAIRRRVNKGKNAFKIPGMMEYQPECPQVCSGSPKTQTQRPSLRRSPRQG